MTNDDMTTPGGYRVGPDARVVIHRHGSRGTYAVAVVLDEGPFSAQQARRRAEALRAEHGGWMSKLEAAEHLGISRRQVDMLRVAGVLDSISDETGHALISVESVRTEALRRSA